MRPVEALQAWMLLFVDYVATKQIIAPGLITLVGAPSKVIEGSYAQKLEPSLFCGTKSCQSLS